jgi:WD40 repeat protein
MSKSKALILAQLFSINAHGKAVRSTICLLAVAFSVSSCTLSGYRGQFNRPGNLKGAKGSKLDQQHKAARKGNWFASVAVGDTVLSVGAAGELLQASSKKAKEATKRTRFTTQPVSAAAFDASATRLVLVLEKSIEIWERDKQAPLDAWDIVAEWAGRTPLVESVIFSPTDHSLLVGGSDGHVYLWRYRSEKYQVAEKFLRGGRRDLIQRYVGHNSPVTSLAFHPSGYTFFSGDEQGVVSSWRRYDDDAYRGGLDSTAYGIRYQQEPARRVNAPRVSTDPIAAVRVSADGEWLAVFSEAGLVELWQTRGMSLAASFETGSGLLLDGVFTELGKGGKRKADSTDERRFVIGTLGRLGASQAWDLQLTRTIEGWKFEKTQGEVSENEGAVALAISRKLAGGTGVCAIVPGMGCRGI